MSPSLKKCCFSMLLNESSSVIPSSSPYESNTIVSVCAVHAVCSGGGHESRRTEGRSATIRDLSTMVLIRYPSNDP